MNINSLYKQILITVIAILSLAIAHAAPEFTHKVNARTVTINGILLGENEKNILKILGEPNKIENQYSEMIDKDTKYLYYKNIIIHLAADEMLGLECIKSCITNKGIKYGSTIKQVFDAYGENKEHIDQASYIFWVPEGYIDAYLLFHFKKGVVSKIEYWVDNS